MDLQFTLDDVAGYFAPDLAFYGAPSAEALCRSVGLHDDAPGDAEIDGDAISASTDDTESVATVVSDEWSQASSSATTSPTVSPVSVEGATAVWDHRRARGKPATSKARARAPPTDTQTRRREVGSGSEIGSLVANLYLAAPKKGVLHRHSGLDKDATLAACDAIENGAVPFGVLAERLGAVARRVLYTSIVPGRTTEGPSSNSDVDLVPFCATEHLMKGAPAPDFVLRPNARVVVLFVPFFGLNYVVTLFRQDGHCTVTGGDGNPQVAKLVADRAVAWANQAGWPGFAVAYLEPVLPLAPTGALQFDYSALVAYWLAALAYSERAASDVRRYLRAMHDVRGALEDPATEAAATASVVGNLVRVLITSRFRLSRDFVMDPFVPFEF